MRQELLGSSGGGGGANRRSGGQGELGHSVCGQVSRAESGSQVHA